MPAQADIQDWVPACAGTSGCGSRFIFQSANAPTCLLMVRSAAGASRTSQGGLGRLAFRTCRSRVNPRSVDGLILRDARPRRAPQDEGERHRPCSLRRGVRRLLPRRRRGLLLSPAPGGAGESTPDKCRGDGAPQGAHLKSALCEARARPCEDARAPRRSIAAFLSPAPCFRAGRRGGLLGFPYPSGFRRPSFPPRPAIQGSRSWCRRTAGQGLPSAGLRAPPAGAAPCSVLAASREDALSRARRGDHGGEVWPKCDYIPSIFSAARFSSMPGQAADLDLTT